jgi:hypothetical protein
VEEIVHETAGFQHQDGSWSIVKVSVRLDKQKHQMKWPPRVKYKERYYILKEDSLEKRPLYIEQSESKELVLVEPTDEQKIEYLTEFCEKQHNQITALVHRVRELERELINERKGSHESKT